MMESWGDVEADDVNGETVLPLKSWGDANGGTLLSMIPDNADVIHKVNDLVNSGVINIADNYGRTPLHWGCIQKDLSFVHTLINKGNWYERSFLMMLLLLLLFLMSTHFSLQYDSLFQIALFIATNQLFSPFQTTNSNQSSSILNLRC